MSTTVNELPTVALFGGTGGTGLALLRKCITRSIPTRLLVRTPSKVNDLLNISSTPSNLHLTKGVISDGTAVRSTMVTSDGYLADVVVSCVGFSQPAFGSKRAGNAQRSSWWSFDLFAGVDDRHICENSSKMLVETLARLRKEGLTTRSGAHSPLLVVLSTTGISTVGRDIPFHMVPLYHLLEPPHKDKAIMEKYLNSIPQHEQEWILIRPSLLTGDGKGTFSGEADEKPRRIRVGIERAGKIERKEIGSVVRREDVGKWIFDELVMKDETEKRKWGGAAVGLTH